MRKLLILSENTGGGHNSCAKAVCQYIKGKDPECEIDIQHGLEFISPELSNLVSDIMNFSYRHAPQIVAAALDKSDLIAKSKILHWIATLGCEKLYKYIKEKGFDTVFCTHPLSGVAICQIKKDHPDFNLKTALLATDYHCDFTGAELDLDWYFIPDISLKEQFAAKVPSERIIATSIPVRPMFFDSKPMDEAKALLGIDPAHKHILVMSGSMGCGGIVPVVSKFTDMFDFDVDVSVICGSNKSMVEDLSIICEDKENFHIHGYTEDISLFMDSADLYVTKPGGISTTEARVKHVPTVLVNAVGGCEIPNLQFFTKLGLAKTADTADGIANLCRDLVYDKKALMAMRNADKAPIESLFACHNIYEVLNS